METVEHIFSVWCWFDVGERWFEIYSMLFCGHHFKWREIGSDYSDSEVSSDKCSECKQKQTKEISKDFRERTAPLRRGSDSNIWESAATGMRKLEALRRTSCVPQSALRGHGGRFHAGLPKHFWKLYSVKFWSIKTRELCWPSNGAPALRVQGPEFVPRTQGVRP